MAEIATRSGKHQVHFYIVSLEPFSSALARTRTSQTALERTGGRFIQGQEELRSQYMEELICASIAKKVSPKALLANVPAQRDKLLTLAMHLWGNRATGSYNREWLQKTIVEGCFPLHPLTTYCLPLLNRQLAQNERTMFSFIWDEKSGLKSFIEEANLKTSDGWLNLLSLDGLFPYFEMSIRERRLDLYSLYQQAKSKLLPEQVDIGLEGRLLQILILLSVTSGDPHLRSDRETLHHALALSPTRSSELVTALSRLEQAGVVYLSQTGYYQLVQQGQANPQELRSIIERRAQKITISPITLLNEQYKPTNVTAASYNKVRGTDRKLLASFVSANDLTTSTSLEEQLQKTDGLLWYAIVRTEEELLNARLAAMQLTKQYNQLVVAIPRTPSDLIERLKYKIALEGLRGVSSEYKKPDYQELLADTGVVGRDYQEAFKRELQRFKSCANFEWYFDGQVTIIRDPHQLAELATSAMRTVFSATPAHRTAQHLAKGSGSPSKLREALDYILSAPFQRSGKKSPTDAILFDGAEPLGLIYLVGQEGGYSKYNVCVPDPSLHQRSWTIWNIFDERLKERDPSVAWLEILEELLRPPFGLSPQVIELFLAAFLRLNRDCIKVYMTKKAAALKVDVTEDIIVKILECPRDYIIQYKALTNQQEAYFHESEPIGSAIHAVENKAQKNLSRHTKRQEASRSSLQQA